MRALAISAAVVGAMVLTGCQTTGNNLGGMEYDKTALGTVIGAAAGYGVSKSNANTSAQNNRAAAIGAIVGGAEDTAQAKMQIMEECGINVVASPADIGKTIAKVLG